MDDQFVFGKNRIHCDNQTITISTPFELVSDGKQVDLGDRGASLVKAEGHNGYLQILVTGDTISEKRNESKLVKEAEEIMKNNSSLSHLETTKQSVSIGNTKGEQLIFHFTETNKGKSTNLIVEEYIFTQENTVWRVIYQYRSGDEIGRALAERVSGKIVLGSEF